MLRNLFSGYLSLNPLMFVWDQYVISGDVPGYHEDLLPIIAAIIFMILRDQLMAVESVRYKIYRGLKRIFLKKNF